MGSSYGSCGGGVEVPSLKMHQYKWYKVVIALLACLLLGIPSIVLFFHGTPFQRGFYCDDDSIRYPHHGETMSAPLVAFLGFGVPLIGIVLFELWRLRIERNTANYIAPVYKIGAKNVHRLFVRLYIVLGFFLIGAIMTQLLEDIMKYGVGRLRPYFLDKCFTEADLKRVCPGSDPHRYVFPIPCTKEQESFYKHKDMRLSFPSGHATFAFYGFVYFLLFIEARVYWTVVLPIGRPIIQFLGILLAAGIGIAIVSDYEHHWSDVMAGTLIGAIMGLIVGLFVAKLFKRRELPEENYRRPGDHLTAVIADVESGPGGVVEIRGKLSPLPASVVGI